MNTLSTDKTKRGFTLVEVLISMVIFGIFSVSVFQLFKHNQNVAESARDLNRVTQIMQYQIENLRATKWDDFSTLAGTKSIHVNSDGIRTDKAETVPFAWQAFTMSQAITLEKAGFYKAVLTVTWTDRRGGQHNHSFETWFVEKGLNAYYTRST